MMKGCPPFLQQQQNRLRTVLLTHPYRTGQQMWAGEMQIDGVVLQEQHPRPYQSPTISDYVCWVSGLECGISVRGAR
jgi:hypothetical protein